MSFQEALDYYIFIKGAVAKNKVEKLCLSVFSATYVKEIAMKISALIFKAWLVLGVIIIMKKRPVI